MLIARTFQEIVSDNAWQRAYWLTVLLTAMNAGLALVVWGTGIESNAVNAVLAASIGLVGLYCGSRMILAGALLGALPYFLIGAAVFYGAGAVFATMNPEPMALLSFTEEVQRSALAKVNLANALSIFLIVAAAGPLCAGLRPEAKFQPGVQSVIGSLESAVPGMMIGSLAVTCLIWATFPASENVLIGSLIRLLRFLPLFTILLGAALWTRLTGPTKLLLILLMLSHVLFGMLALVKVLTLLPVLVLVLGWWLNGNMTRPAVIVTVVTCVVYFASYAELVTLARFHANLDPLLNSIPDRVRIIFDSIDTLNDLRAGDLKGNIELRFATAPFQAHFMALYDTGFPGDFPRSRADHPDPAVSVAGEADLRSGQRVRPDLSRQSEREPSGHRVHRRGVLEPRLARGRAGVTGGRRATRLVYPEMVPVRRARDLAHRDLPAVADGGL